MDIYKKDIYYTNLSKDSSKFCEELLQINERLFINFYAHDTNKNILAFTLHNNVPITILSTYMHSRLILLTALWQ